MLLELWREKSNDKCTHGILYIDGFMECLTLEDVIRDIKIPKMTAIPAGVYDIVLEDSPRFGPDTITLKNVPGFTYVRIHGGNKADDTDGCVITGTKYFDDYTILESQKALKLVKEKIKAALNVGEGVTLEIHNPV